MRRRSRLRRYPVSVADEVLTLEGLRRRRPEILHVARKRRAHRIAVFGSVARGEARPDSDLDLLAGFELHQRLGHQHGHEGRWPRARIGG